MTLLETIVSLLGSNTSFLSIPLWPVAHDTIAFVLEGHSSLNLFLGG